MNSKYRTKILILRLVCLSYRYKWKEDTTFVAINASIGKPFLYLDHEKPPPPQKKKKKKKSIYNCLRKTFGAKRCQDFDKIL